MLSAARICKRKYASTAFDGMGAAREPGRWNSAGHRVVYTSDCPALAFLEMLIHADGELMSSYVLFTLTFENALVEAVDEAALPPGWRSLLEPAWAPLQQIGTDWLISKRTPILRVPTVIVPYQYNYLLNPDHQDFGNISIGKEEVFAPDPRLK
jgi:RES domain-containing protein